MDLIKGILATSVTFLLIIFGYNWLGNRGGAKLRPDGVNIYKNEKELIAQLPYANQTYVGQISQPIPKSSKRAGAKYFLKMVLVPEVPSQVFASRLKALSAQDKSENNAAKYQRLIKMTEASVKMRIPIVHLENGAGETVQCSTNIGKTVNVAEDILSVFTGSSILSFDRMDNHKFDIIAYRLAGDDLRFEFSQDFKTCKIRGKDNLSGELWRADQLQQFDLSGYYHINFKLVSLGNPHLGADLYSNENQINHTAQAFFKPGENFQVGKIFIRNKPYDLRGYKEGGYFRLFTGNGHYIQIRPGQKSTSYLACDFGNNEGFDDLDAIYLTELIKAPLPAGKEEEMFSNFDRLGNSPGSDIYNPESWSYFEKLSPWITELEDIIRDDDLWQVYKMQNNLRQYMQTRYGIRAYVTSYNPDAAREKILAGKSAAGDAKSTRPTGTPINKKKNKNTLDDIL